MITPLGQITGELRDVREWALYSGNQPSLVTTPVYTGGYALRSAYAVGQPSIAFPVQTSGIRAGMWFRHNLSYLGNCYLMTLHDASRSATLMTLFYHDTTKVVTFQVGSVVVGTYTLAQLNMSTPNAWMHIGMTYLPALGKCTIYIDGLPVTSYSGEITGTPQIIGFAGGGWATYAYMDDMYLDGGIETDEAPPPDRFLFRIATSAGSTAQWTPTGAATNVACVDDAPPNDDTDYVKAEAADLIDLYTIAPFVLPSDYGIIGVTSLALVKRMASGPTVKLLASDGVNTIESDEKTPTVSYGYSLHTMSVAPDNSDWGITPDKVNATQFGIKSTGLYA